MTEKKKPAAKKAAPAKKASPAKKAAAAKKQPAAKKAAKPKALTGAVTPPVKEEPAPKRIEIEEVPSPPPAPFTVSENFLQSQAKKSSLWARIFRRKK